MSQQINARVAVVGIDIGKNSFHIVGQDGRGEIVLRQKWSRSQVETRFANMSLRGCCHRLSAKTPITGTTQASVSWLCGAIQALAYSGECIMSWRVAACTVASVLVITLPALAQPSTTPSTRPPPDPSTTDFRCSVAEQELIRKLEKAGYTQVRDVKSTAEGIAAKALKDGKEVSLVVDSSGKFRER